MFPLTQCGSGSGNMFTIGCLATGFRPAPLTFKWAVDGTALNDFVQYPTVEKGDVYTGVSQIRVQRGDWESKKTFTCTVEHSAGTKVYPFVKPGKLMSKQLE